MKRGKGNCHPGTLIQYPDRPNAMDPQWMETAGISNQLAIFGGQADLGVTARDENWCGQNDGQAFGPPLQGTEVDTSSKVRGIALEVTWVGIIIVTWETFKWGVFRRRPQVKTALIQTSGQSIVTLPLAEGVPNRARIMFSLWQAGYDVEVSEYPEEVQEEYFGLLGGHLERMSEASSEE